MRVYAITIYLFYYIMYTYDVLLFTRYMIISRANVYIISF